MYGLKPVPFKLIHHIKRIGVFSVNRPGQCLFLHSKYRQFDLGQILELPYCVKI